MSKCWLLSHLCPHHSQFSHALTYAFSWKISHMKIFYRQVNDFICSPSSILLIGGSSNAILISLFLTPYLWSFAFSQLSIMHFLPFCLVSINNFSQAYIFQKIANYLSPILPLHMLLLNLEFICLSCTFVFQRNSKSCIKTQSKHYVNFEFWIYCLKLFSTSFLYYASATGKYILISTFIIWH